MSRPVALGSELTSTNVNTSDYAGFYVTASADGTRIAYAVQLDDQNGTNAGAVRVFDWSGTAWTQVGSDILGSSTLTYLSRVDLSDDGSRVFVGSGSANYVQAYDYDTGTSDWVQTGSDITGSGNFGYGLACSADGDRVVIGAYNAGTGGEVEVYDWSGTAWTQVGSTITTGTAATDYFGISVSISENGSRIAAGSMLDDTPASGAGSVRIFDWNGTAWTQVGTDITGVTGADNEGVSVSLSSDGSRVATGASNNTTTGFGTTSSGRARVFEYDTGTSDWVQMGTEIYGLASSNLARIVSLSGDGTRLAVGAYQGDTAGGVQSGNIRVFDWNGHEWAQFDEALFLSTQATNDFLGYSVALSRDGLTLIGGAYLDDVSGTADTGSVKIWSVPAPTWTQQGGDVQLSLTSSSAELFGESADISSDGSRFVAGGHGYSSNSGAFEVFELDSATSAWDSIGYVTGPSSSQFGKSVAISSDGSTVVVGAPSYSSATGFFEVYDYSGGTTWTQRGSRVTGPNTASDFGQYVAISDDGNTVVIAEPRWRIVVHVYEWSGSAWTQKGNLISGSSGFGKALSCSSDGETIAIGHSTANSNTGAVEVYGWSGSAWTQLGSDIVGENTSQYFGNTVALSSDGTRFVSGSYGNDDAGSNFGQARVFDWNGTAWTQVGTDILGESTGEQFGFAVGISGNGSRIVVAANAFDDAAQNIGKHQAFDYDAATSDWVQVGQNVVGDTPEQYGAYTKVGVTSDGKKFLVTERAYDSPGTNDGRVRVFQIVQAPGFKYWDGTAFVDSTAVQYWDGSAWVDVTGIQYWDGSAWTDPS